MLQSANGTTARYISPLHNPSFCPAIAQSSAKWCQSIKLDLKTAKALKSSHRWKNPDVPVQTNGGGVKIWSNKAECLWRRWEQCFMSTRSEAACSVSMWAWLKPLYSPSLAHIGSRQLWGWAGVSQGELFNTQLDVTKLLTSNSSNVRLFRSKAATLNHLTAFFILFSHTSSTATPKRTLIISSVIHLYWFHWYIF